MMDTFASLLPGGYIDAAGVRHRVVELIPLNGSVEELVTRGHGENRAALVTRILSRCVCRIGDISPVTERLARELLVADRQFLMLKLRELTFGDQVQAVMYCPWSDCRQRIDVDFLLNDISVIEAPNLSMTYTLNLSEAAAYCDETGVLHRKIVFRLPTGADQERSAPHVRQNEAMALSRLLSFCVSLDDGQPLPCEEVTGRLNPAAIAEIDQAMAIAAPRVELDLTGVCPECDRAFTCPFDVQGFLFDELRVNRLQLYREVHYLAYHYHWSEQEIMNLPKAKRRMYIEILADEVERLNNGVR